MEYLRNNIWDQDILRHLRYGGKLMGICGGYQMLGKTIHDPEGIEGKSGSTAGLGLLDLTTTMVRQKRLQQVSGTLKLPGQQAVTVTGYEIHAGITTGSPTQSPLIQLENHTDGVISDDGQVMGTYLHGIFESPEACQAILEWAGLKTATTTNYHKLREEGINRMADAVETHLDMDHLPGIINTEAGIYT